MNRILFVDDEPRVLAGLRRILRSRQGVWDMRFVEDAATALEAMEREPVDVIVSDFRMPGLDGGQLLAEVRRRCPDTARLILSGQAAESDMIRVVTIAHQFLTKPCEPDELVGAIERALRLRDDLDGERVRSEMVGVGGLPGPTSTLHNLLATLESPGCDDRAVAAVLEGDPTLAARVLEQVNLLLIPRSSRVDSLEAALARLGIQTIRSLALWSEITRAFPLPDRLSRGWLELLKTHALETALLARRLAAPEARDDAFCAGLLHECGQLVFAVCRPDVFTAHLRLRDREARLLVEIERQSFGVTHGQAGAHLLSLWGFPLEIVEAAAHHANVLGPQAPRPLSARAAVRLAHLVVEGERIRLCSPPGNLRIDDATLERADVLGDVWAWRAEQMAVQRGQGARRPGRHLLLRRR